MVINKVGWVTIDEVIISHTNLVLIERPRAKEDSFNIKQLKNKIDYEKLHAYKNDVSKIVELILVQVLI